MSLYELSAEKDKTKTTLQNYQHQPTQGTSIPCRNHRKKHGQVFPIEITVSPYQLYDEKLMMCNVRDISERQASENVLLENADYFSNLERINRILVAASANDINGCLKSLSEALLDIFQSDRAWFIYPCDPDAEYWEVPVETTRAEFPGVHARQIKVPASPEVSKLFRQALNTSGPMMLRRFNASLPTSMFEQFSIQSQLFQAIRPDRDSPWLTGLHQCRDDREWSDFEIRLFAAIAERITLGLSNLLLLQQLERDIQQQKIADEAVRRSELLFSMVATHAPVGIFVTNAQGEVSYVNQQWCYLSGMPAEQASGNGWVEAIHPEDRETVLQNWAGTMHNGNREYIDELRLRRPDGNIAHLQVRAIPFQDSEGGVEGYIGTISDVTELKRLQRELSQGRKMESMGQLTGGIAHDFNNILASILGFSGLALTRFYDVMPEKLSNYLAEINKAGIRGRDLVRQMLTFARGDDMQTAELNLAPLVKEVSKMLSSTFPSSIKIVLKFETDLPRVLIDPTQLHQLVMNLCINARDAMYGSGELTLELKVVRDVNAECMLSHNWVTGDWIELCVSDTGSGIENNILDRIFDPFFTTKEVGKSTGMGLAVASSIVQLHHGHLMIESVVGRGSSFHLLFPFVHDAAVGTGSTGNSNSKSVSLTGNGRKILVVDDEPSLVLFMTDLLQGCGFVVSSVNNSRQALDLLKQQPGFFDLLISDQTMPDLTGSELVQASRNSNPDLPVIICSGYSEYMDVGRAQEIGIQRFLNKPVDPDELIEAVHSVLNVKPQ